jgi:hypothetical protein
MSLDTHTIDPIITSDAKIADYVQLVNTKASQKSKELLPNAGAKHAAIAMSKLFDETNYSVRMVVNSFSKTVCDQPIYFNSLKACVEKGVKFRIIHIDDLNDKSETCIYLINAQSQNMDISFHRASNEFKNKLTVDNTIRHFAVFDEDKFRYETDTENYVAFFCFNDPENATILAKAFDKEF